MVKFERNWNVFGIGESLLFPTKRAGQPEIQLARLLKEFFEFEGGKCLFHELNGEIILEWFYDKNQVLEQWTISDVRGSLTPNEARNMDPNCGHLHMKIKEVDLVFSLKNLLVNYPNCEIDLGKIIGMGVEGTVLEDSSEGLNSYAFGPVTYVRFRNGA